LINRYTLLVQNLDDQKRELLEELPVSLTYEITKPSANEDLKQKVLDGEVKSLKEYKGLEARLKQVISWGLFAVFMRQGGQKDDCYPTESIKVILV
jgi:hypothetical protein